jgi:hypothetical protein
MNGCGHYFRTRQRYDVLIKKEVGLPLIVEKVDGVHTGAELNHSVADVVEHKLYTIICIDDQFLLAMNRQTLTIQSKQFPLHSSATCGVLKNKSDKNRVKAYEMLVQSLEKNRESPSEGRDDYCGGLNENGPCWKCLGGIRRCGLAEGGVSLGLGFEVSERPCPSLFSFLCLLLVSSPLLSQCHA